MDQLISAFGIDLQLIILQILNFGLLAAGLTYLLYKPVLRLLKERQQRIEQGIKDAEKAEKMRANAETEKQEILVAAHNEAKEVAARAKVHAEEKGKEIVKQAEQKAGLVVDQAKLAGEEIKTRSLKESETEIAKTAILAAEKILRERST